MPAQLLEFVLNHPLLCGAFTALLLLLIVTESRRGGKSLSSRELTALVNSEQGVVLDVRPDKDFAAGHITGSVNIPYAALAGRIGELEKYKGKTLIVVDANGQHAGSACRTLHQAEHKASRLAGGIGGWRADSLPVVR